MSTEKQANTKSLAVNAGMNAIYSLSNIVFPLISSIYASRILEAEGIGKVAFAQNIVSYFIMFAMLGIPTYGIREIARVKEDRALTNQVFSELFTLNAVTTTISMAVYFLVMFRVDAEVRWIYAVCGIELLLNYINIDWYYKGQEEYTYITLRTIIVKLCSLLLLFVVVREKNDFIGYALLHGLGIGCNNIFNIIHSRKSVSLKISGIKPKRHLTPILVLFTSTLAASLYSKVDITMLGMMQNDTVVGYYTNAYKIVSLVLGTVASVTAVFLPRLSSVYHTDRIKFERLVSGGIKIVLLLAVPAVVGLILVAEDLMVAAFGSSFSPAVKTMQILAPIILIIGCGDLLCYQVVICSGNEKMLIKSRVYAGAANIVLNALLIPRFQQNGAALASVVSELIVNGMLLRFSFLIVKPQITKTFVASLLFSVVIMAVSVSAIRQIGMNTLMSLCVSVLSGIVIYFVILIVLKNDAMISLIHKIKARKESIR